MKNFNILGVHWKIRLLIGGVHKNLVQRGGLPKKGAVIGQFADLRWAWQKRGGGVLLRGVYTPMHTMNPFIR